MTSIANVVFLFPKKFHEKILNPCILLGRTMAHPTQRRTSRWAVPERGQWGCTDDAHWGPRGITLLQCVWKGLVAETTHLQIVSVFCKLPPMTWQGKVWFHSPQNNYICLKKCLPWVTAIYLKPSMTFFFFFSSVKFCCCLVDLYTDSRVEDQPEVRRLAAVPTLPLMSRGTVKHTAQFSFLNCTLSWWGISS